MNVAQELGDDELYDYDILVKLLGDRFDPASRVSASRSRFMAGHDVITRMLNYAGLATHRARQSFAKS